MKTEIVVLSVLATSGCIGLVLLWLHTFRLKREVRDLREHQSPVKTLDQNRKELDETMVKLQHSINNYLGEGKYKLISCQILEGAFSGEKIAQILLANGELHTATVGKTHCWEFYNKQAAVPFKNNGLLACRIMDDRTTKVRAEIPNGDLILVSSALIREPDRTALSLDWDQIKVKSE